MNTLPAAQSFDLEIYRALVAYNGDILFSWDLTTDTFITTPNWFDIFGYMPPVDNFTKTLETSSTIYPDDKKLFKDYLETIQFSGYTRKKGKYYSKMEIRIRNIYLKYVWCKVSLMTDYSEQNLPCRISGMITNIDFNKKHEETLVEKAQRDLLTGLYNKATTTQMIEDWLKNSPPNKAGALVIIDLDGFKAVNDNFGHLFGDAILADIAKTIKNTFLATDIIGRIGGDEFIVFVKEIYSLTVLKKNLKRLNTALCHTYQNKGITYCVSASIGLALYPAHGKKYESLFKQADQAMYYVKNHGKNDFMIYRDRLPVSTGRKSINDNTIIAADKSFDDNLGEYIVKLLSTTHNQLAATTLLLEIIGKKLNACRAFIYEKNAQEDVYNKTVEWCDHGTPYFSQKLEKITPDDFSDFFKAATPSNMLVCNDVSKLRIGFGAICEAEVQALLLSPIIASGSIQGYIGFAEHQHRRQWAEFEINTVTSLAGLIGVFWEKNQIAAALTSHQENMADSLNALSSYIYIQDNQTKEIVFINRALQEFLNSREADPEVDTASLLAAISSQISTTPIVWQQNSCSLIELAKETTE